MVKSAEVCVLGAASVDWIAHVKELPHRDGISWVERFEPHPGGSGANIAEALARLGKHTRFLGRLGDDDGGKLLLESFRQSGVDLSATRIETGARSSACFIAVDSHGNRQIYSLGGTANYERPEDIDPTWLKSSKILVITDAYPDVSNAAIHALDADALVLFNPGGLMAGEPLHQLEPILRQSHALIVSKIEAQMISGIEDAEESTCFLSACGPDVVIQTLGAEGALLCKENILERIPSFSPTKVIDTTGAGDAFNAGVIAGLLENKDWHAAVRLGCAVAAMKVSHFGARSGLPDRQQVQLFIQNQQNPINHDEVSL